MRSKGLVSEYVPQQQEYYFNHRGEQVFQQDNGEDYGEEEGSYERRPPVNPNAGHIGSSDKNNTSRFAFSNDQRNEQYR